MEDFFKEAEDIIWNNLLEIMETKSMTRSEYAEFLGISCKTLDGLIDKSITFYSILDTEESESMMGVLLSEMTKSLDKK